MDEERVMSAIQEAGCELSRVGIADHLRNGAEGVLQECQPFR